MKSLNNEPNKHSGRAATEPQNFPKADGYFPMTNLRIEDLLETQKILAPQMYNDEFWENIEKDPTLVTKR
ncbi:MAG: hypothetical protein QM523_01405 [Candidatus Pacebacteria bacterium]|nr:hypothetical protein [Candidatus Paceibacterota bacterium]